MLTKGGGGVSQKTLTLAGEVIKPAPKAKSLGLIISEDMNWTDGVDTRLAKCSHKLRSLKRSGDNGAEEGIGGGGDIQQAKPALKK